MRRWQQAVAQDDAVEVAELDGVRHLYIGSDTVQSAMRLSQPDALELAYARGMMSYLLFQPQAKQILLLGLGGGSIAKFIYRHLPECVTTVLEIHAQVIHAARQYFLLPENDARLQVIHGDGIAYVRQPGEAVDVLMLDAYGSRGVVAEMVSQDFFDCCAARLSADGILVVNLWGSDRHFDLYYERIQRSFSQRTLLLRTGKPGNIVVLAFAQQPKPWNGKQLRQHAAQLQQQYGLEMVKFLQQMLENDASQAHGMHLGEST